MPLQNRKIKSEQETRRCLVETGLGTKEKWNIITDESPGCLPAPVVFWVTLKRFRLSTLILIINRDTLISFQKSRKLKMILKNGKKRSLTRLKGCLGDAADRNMFCIHKGTDTPHTDTPLLRPACVWLDILDWCTNLCNVPNAVDQRMFVCRQEYS